MYDYSVVQIYIRFYVYITDALARRLETEKDGRLSPYAGLCYICSGNLDKFVQNWNENTDVNNTPLSLQVSYTYMEYKVVYNIINVAIDRKSNVTDCCFKQKTGLEMLNMFHHCTRTCIYSLVKCSV